MLASSSQSLRFDMKSDIWHFSVMQNHHLGRASADEKVIEHMILFHDRRNMLAAEKVMLTFLHIVFDHRSNCESILSMNRKYLSCIAATR
jgi:hypothetical protein